jgi:hypothetical protein
MSRWDDDCAARGYSLRASFIPWCRSRHYTGSSDEPIDKRSLNWRVTLLHNNRRILSTLYTAGIAHCPSYPRPYILRKDIPALMYETHTGRRFGTTERILPSLADVIHSLLLDAEIFDHANGFDAYHAEYGGTRHNYRQLQHIAISLHARLGREEVETLRALLNEM